MKKTKIIYSLTERGLFSELSNLALALVYARRHGMSLEVNTRRWCARVDRGWTDYFEPTVDENDSLMASQFRIFETGGLWIGTLYYHTRDYIKYYIPKTLNRLYSLAHPRTMLSSELVPLMRQRSFLYDSKADIFADYAAAFKSLLRYNAATADYIDRQKRQTRLPADYIAVHIRRGDKIAIGEMKPIAMDDYVREVVARREISTNVYVATDDASVVAELKPRFEQAGFRVYHNQGISDNGYDQFRFNSGSREARRQGVLDTLLDMDILLHARYFVGTFSSNVGRIVPLFLGFHRCRSLDEEWSYGEKY